ncbi:MAG: iron-sulfur cluster assembly protein [Halodesulfurarchaeum sp.]|nr:iron-sulfur cluster assembly protein [Halodesulfurarchaeum sp.]
MQEADVREILSGIEDPDLGTDIVSENLVSGIDLDGESVTVKLALTAIGSPTEEQIRADVREALEAEGLSVTLEPDSAESAAAGSRREHGTDANVRRNHFPASRTSSPSPREKVGSGRVPSP